MYYRDFNVPSANHVIKGSVCIWLVCDNLTLVPSPAHFNGQTRGFFGWRGECKREGASPPLKTSPPLKQTYFLSHAILLFERGIKGGEFKRGEFR